MRIHRGARVLGCAVAAATALAMGPVASSAGAQEAEVVTCGGLEATVVGTDGDDVLTGTDGPDVIAGLGGEDVIVGLGGDDVICGGEGDDVLVGGDGDDVLRGGPGDDRLVGGAGDDDMSGSRGEDCVDYSGDDDATPRTDADPVDVDLAAGTATGYAGSDTLRLIECVITGQGADTVLGDDRDNTVVVPAGVWDEGTPAPPADTFDGRGGTDTIEVFGTFDVDLAAGTFVDRRRGDGQANPYGGTMTSFENATVRGTGRLSGDAGPNVLTVDASDPATVTGAELVVVRGRAGDDLIIGSHLADVIRGGPGDDEIHGKGGDDDLSGSRGDDVVRGGAGDDTIRGASGNDRLFGGRGDDTMFGGPGKDDLRGGAGDDFMSGSRGHDVLRGGPGADVMHGRSGNDWLSGGKDDDRIFGNAGDDRLFGRSGDDVLRGGAGRDRIDGGRGSDACFSPSRPPRAVRC